MMRSLPLQNCCCVIDLITGFKVIVFLEFAYLIFVVSLFIGNFPAYEQIFMIFTRALLLQISGHTLNFLKTNAVKWIKIYVQTKLCLEILNAIFYIVYFVLTEENNDFRQLLYKIIFRVVIITIVQLYFVLCIYSLQVTLWNIEIWPQIAIKLISDPKVTYKQISCFRQDLEKGKFGIPPEKYQEFKQRMAVAEIKDLPTIICTEEILENQNKECSICLTEFTNQEALKQLTCKHSFHANCIEQWLSQHVSCPLCRVSQRKSST